MLKQFPVDSYTHAFLPRRLCSSYLLVADDILRFVDISKLSLDGNLQLSSKSCAVLSNLLIS